MICVFDIGNNDFTTMGNAVLVPKECKLKNIAGGNYDLTMTHPIDPTGKWKHLQPGAVIRCPVPEEKIENAFSGYAADVYKTTAEAVLREEANEPTAINYGEWGWQVPYQVGSKVSVSGWSHHNYQCTYYDGGSQQIMVPPYNSSWWTPIADYTSGSPVLVTLPAGTDLYFVEDYNTNWYKMSTYYGIVGYIKKSQVVYDRHLTPSETTPRIIRDQLFRIEKPTVDTKNRTVSVTAKHVSYDLAGILIKDVNIAQASPAMAIGRIVEGFMIEYEGTIATNLQSDENGTYTQQIKGKNGIYALLDPDKGIVSSFNAAYKRDNWDLFVMTKESVDRGFTLVYRKNMLGVNWAQDSSGMVTRVVPIAKDEAGADLYLPELWVDSPLIGNYPVIKMERMSVSGQVGKPKVTGGDTLWTLSDLLDEMRTKAGERFTVDKADQVVDTVTVDFEQLGDTEEYAALKRLESVLLYDTVTVRNEEIGLNKQLYVGEWEWDAIREKITALKLVNTTDYKKGSVTGYNVQSKSISSEKLMDDVKDEIIDQVVDVIPEYADPQASRPATIPLATDSALGGIKTGFTPAPANRFYPVSLYNEKAFVEINEAAQSNYGVVRIGYANNNKNYGVLLNSSGQMYVNIPWADRSTWYGTSDTAAATQAKTATVDNDFSLTTGARVSIKFTYAQTYNGQPTLNVNSTGDINITIRGTTAAARYEWNAGEIIDFVYDGTNWVMVDSGHATTSYYGKTKLNDTLTSTSTAQALTANQGKVLNDKFQRFSCSEIFYINNNETFTVTGVSGGIFLLYNAYGLNLLRIAADGTVTVGVGQNVGIQITTGTDSITIKNTVGWATKFVVLG